MERYTFKRRPDGTFLIIMIARDMSVCPRKSSVWDMRIRCQVPSGPGDGNALNKSYPTIWAALCNDRTDPLPMHEIFRYLCEWLRHTLGPGVMCMFEKGMMERQSMYYMSEYAKLPSSQHGVRVD